MTFEHMKSLKEFLIESKTMDFNPAKEIKASFPLKDIKLYKASKVFSDDRYMSRYNQNVLFASIPVKKSKYWTKPEIDVIIEAIQYNGVTYFSVEFYGSSRARGIIVTTLEHIEDFAQYMTSGYTTKKEYEMKDYGDGEIQRIEHENVVEKPMPKQLKTDMVTDETLRKTLVKMFYEEYEREVNG